MRPVNNFFINGIITSRKEANKTARKIEDLTGLKVDVFYNKSTPLTKIISIAGKVIYGVLGLGYYATTERKSEKEADDRTIIAAGSVAALGLGIKEWHDVQVDKAKHGKALADRVEAHLVAHPNESVRLILHSQGAHVGLNALKHLKDYKERIQVVNLGGMVEIPKHMASQVTNLSNSKDPVPNWISRLTSKGREWVDLGDGHTKTWLAHEMKEYLRHQVVQDLLKMPAAAPAA
ncbi:MAG: hypothetical protein KFB93_05530 [Simkaniaceae bacterium]|nr:MAG: hypothetical protein KFB93_05530 [Simkaniaceae bacterium]